MRADGFWIHRIEPFDSAITQRVDGWHKGSCRVMETKMGVKPLVNSKNFDRQNKGNVIHSDVRMAVA